MIFTAASELIQAALEAIEAQDPGEAMTPQDAATGLRELNLLLDEYSLDRGKMFIRTEDLFTLVVGILCAAGCGGTGVGSAPVVGSTGGANGAGGAVSKGSGGTLTTGGTPQAAHAQSSAREIRSPHSPGQQVGSSQRGP